MPDDLATRPAAAHSLRAQTAPNTWNPEARTVDVVWTTGAEVKRRDFWTDQAWIERLDVSADAVDLARLNAGAPVLDTHSSYALGDVVGVVESARIEGGKGTATLRFSDRPEVAGIVRDVAQGILRNISVGYTVEQWDIAKRDGAAEIRTAKRWTPYELSLVPVPADAGAQVRSGPAIPPAAPPPNQESTMSEQVIDPAAEAARAQAAAAASETNLRKAAEQAAAAERTRVGEIMAAARAAGLPADWAEKHIGEGTSADTVRRLALEDVAARATPRVAPMAAGSRQDEGDTQRRLLQNALEHRARVPGVELEEGARQFRGYKMLDFARASIDFMGGSSRGLTPMETFQRAMSLSNGQRITRAGVHTSGDFAELLANTASKSLRSAYEFAPRTFVPWCTRRDLPDFKAFTPVALGGAPALAAIAEDGEVTYGTLADAAETCTLVRYGKGLAISYVALVNDDMAGFSRLPSMFAASAARLESTAVYGVLTTNGAMADGNNLISAAHANTTTGALSADATGVTNVGKVQALIRKQTAPNGDVLDLNMRFLLLPAALETIGNQLFAATNVVTNLNAVNPYRNSVQVITEARLDATSAVAFYGIADPMQVDTIWYGYLEGEDGPVISQNVDFDTDGMKMKCMHNFYAQVVDHRGIAYSTGA